MNGVDAVATIARVEVVSSIEYATMMTNKTRSLAHYRLCCVAAFLGSAAPRGLAHGTSISRCPGRAKKDVWANDAHYVLGLKNAARIASKSDTPGIGRQAPIRHVHIECESGRTQIHETHEARRSTERINCECIAHGWVDVCGSVSHPGSR